MVKSKEHPPDKSLRRTYKESSRVPLDRGQCVSLWGYYGGIESRSKKRQRERGKEVRMKGIGSVVESETKPSWVWLCRSNVS